MDTRLSHFLGSGLLLASIWTSGTAHSKPDVRVDSVVRNLVQQSADKQEQSRVIVRLKKELGADETRAIARLGGDIYRHLELIHSVAATFPRKNLKKLLELPFVEHVSSDALVKKNDNFTVGHSGADVVWAANPKLPVEHVLVAVIDSGINEVEDLKGSVKFAQSFVAGDPTTDDLCGHGTHVAGILAGTGKMSSGKNYTQTFQGIAPGVKLASLKVLDANGVGSVSDVTAAMQTIVNVVQNSGDEIKWPKKTRVIINLSIGHPVNDSYQNDPLCQMAEAVWKKGVIVVCSAGNNGRLQDTFDASLDNSGYGTAYGTVNSPGNDPYVITVGAMKNPDGYRGDDQIASYSSRGPTRLDFVLKPDLVAPGNKVISTDAGAVGKGKGKGYGWLRNHYPDNLLPFSAYFSGDHQPEQQAYYQLSGTSMAAPVVSGAVALMLAKDLTLSPDTIKARLMLTADKWTNPDGTSDPCTFGAGMVNIPAAISSTIVAANTAVSPRLYRNADGTVALDMSDANLWGTKAIWGTQTVWYTQAIWGTKAIWGNKAIWGTDDLLTSSKAIWGVGLVWDNKAIWGVDTFQADFSRSVIDGDN